MRKAGTVIQHEPIWASHVYRKTGERWLLIYGHGSGLPPAAPKLAEENQEVMAG